jgi:hypothetical protein
MDNQDSEIVIGVLWGWCLWRLERFMFGIDCEYHVLLGL